MDFTTALDVANKGGRIARIGWNGTGQWVGLSPGRKNLPTQNFWSQAARDWLAENKLDSADVEPCMIMKTVHGTIKMGWVPSLSDMASADWYVVR